MSTISNVLIALYDAAEAAALITAAKVDELKEKHPDLAEEIDALNEEDPSPTKKYLGWAVKQLVAGEDAEDLSNVVKEFHEVGHRLAKRDIYQYKTLADLIEELSKLGSSPAAQKAQRRAVAKKDAVYLFNDDDYVLLHPKSTEASCHYGAGAKWCISAKMSNMFDNYSSSNKFFYFLIDKKQPPKAKWSKVAIVLQKDSKTFVELYDAENKMHTLHEVLEQDIGPKVLESVALAHRHMRQQPDTWQYTIQNSESPEEIAKIYEAKKDVASVRKTVAANGKTPEAILDELASDDDSEVREAVARNPSTSTATIDRLASDKDEDVRNKVALSEKTSPEVLVKLLTDDSMYVKQIAAGNKRTPISAIESNLQLLSDEGRFRVSIIDRLVEESTNAEVLNLLANDDSNWTRRRVANSPHITPEIVQKLLNDDDEGVKSDLASNKAVPIELLAPLANEDYHLISTLLTSRPDAPSSFLETAARKILSDNRLEYTNISLALEIADHPNVTTALVDSLYDKFKTAALAERPDYYVKNGFSKLLVNPKLSPTKLTEALDNEKTRQTALANPAVSPEMLARLADSDDENLVRIIAENPSTPVEVLANLSGRDNRDIVEAVIANPSVTSEILGKIAKDQKWAADYSIVQKLSSSEKLGVDSAMALLRENDKSHGPAFVNRLAENTKHPEVIEHIIRLLPVLRKSASRSWTASLLRKILKRAKSTPEVVPTAALVAISKGSSEAAVMARELLATRPDAPKSRKRKSVAAAIEDLAEKLHQRRVPVPVLLAVEEAAELMTED